MQDEAHSKEPLISSGLSTDTMADKAIRFGCAAMLAPMVILAAVWIGVFEFMSTGALLVVTLVVAVLFGILGVAQGDGFIVGVLNVLKKLT